MNGWTLDELYALDESYYETLVELYLEEQRELKRLADTQHR